MSPDYPFVAFRDGVESGIAAFRARVGYFASNVTAAAGRRKSRTMQGATLGSPRIDRP
jgi:hypothetical protein